MEKRHSQGRNIVGARLHVELPPACSLLKEDLPVTQGRSCRFVARDVIALPETHAAQNAVHAELAERSAVENSWRGRVQRPGNSWRREWSRSGLRAAFLRKAEAQRQRRRTDSRDLSCMLVAA